jgi:tetratricopeptide (TPR) repeat protein
MAVDLDDKGIQTMLPDTNPAPAPADLRTLIEIAQSFERANNWDEAEHSWRGVLLADEKAWLPHLALAQIFARLGRSDELKKALEAAEKCIPDDNYVAKARVAELAENWVAATERWRVAVENLSDVWQHHVSLARSLEKLGEVSKCIGVLWKAEVRFPANINIVSELAQVAQRHGKWAESERCWRKYMAAVPNDVYVRRHLAFVTRKSRLNIDPETKESSLFNYRTFDDAVKLTPNVVRYHELNEPVLSSLAPPSFRYGGSEEFIDEQMNHLKYYFGTGVFEVIDAQIFRERLVRCGDFILYGHQVESREQAIQDKLDEELLLPIRELKLRRSARPLVSLQIGAYPVYGHWLVDVMPQVFALRELGIQLDDFDFVLPDLLPPYHREFLSYCEIKQEQILIHDHHTEMIGCATLLIPTHMNNTRTFIPSFAKSAQWFRKNIERQHGKLRDESRPKRLFVSRRDVTSGRPLVNRDEIIKIALSRGFHVMLPETLPLVEQWRYFASADLIVGEYGSALHSSILSEPGTVVCCLRGSTNSPGYLQSGIGEALSQPTGYIFGRFVEAGNDRRYAVDPMMFMECLDFLILQTVYGK